jgi:hypothetical protein
MPQWATFAGFTIVVTAGLLLLSHASRGVLDDESEPRADSTDGNVVFDNGDARSRRTVVDPDDRGHVADDTNRVDRVAANTDRADPVADDDVSDRDEGGETIVLPKSGVEIPVTEFGAGGNGGVDDDRSPTSNFSSSCAKADSA